MTRTKRPANSAELIAADAAADLVMLEVRQLNALVRQHWIVAAARNPQRFRPVDVVHGYLKSLKAEAQRGSTVAQVAAHLDLSTSRVNDLIDKGVIARKPRGEYDLGEARRAYCRYLSATAAGRGAAGEGDASLASARAKLTAMRAEQAELEILKARGEFVSLDLIMRGLRARVEITRDRILSVAGEVADSLVGRTREDIMETLDDKLRDVLNELAEPIPYTDEMYADPITEQGNTTND